MAAAGTTALLDASSLTIGTADDSDLRLTDPACSRRHLMLTMTAEGVLAEDLQSTNGTFVAGGGSGRATSPAERS